MIFITDWSSAEDLRTSHEAVRPPSNVVWCLSLAQRAALRGPVPPTSGQRMIKRPDRRPGDQAPDLHFLVAGAGFEPATSGL